ncbi:MAG: hypothetical protein K0Q93_2136 [Nocardioidaceae bacterium]|jgi:hypothetical protein|nr:hypothetical protein [Nocardioidaceae bacterium]
MAAEVLTWIDPDGTELELYVDWNVNGRFMPPVSYEEGTVPGQPGARFRSVRHGPRDFVLPVRIADQDPAVLRTLLRSVVRSMDPTRGAGRIRVASPAGDQREITCRYVSGLEMPERLGDTSGPGVQWASPVFRAHDPYWADVADTVDLFGLGARPSFFPFFPLRLSRSSVFAEASVINGGDVATWPVWQITGPGSIISARNLTTGRSWTLSLALGAGERIYVDTRPGRKTARLNDPVDGVSVFTAFTAMPSLWPLAPGNNALRIEMSSAVSGQSEVQLARRHLYLSA